MVSSNNYSDSQMPPPALGRSKGSKGSECSSELHDDVGFVLVRLLLSEWLLGSLLQTARIYTSYWLSHCQQGHINGTS